MNPDREYDVGMIITRRPGESVVIGDVRVTVVRTRNGRVKLSIEAPPQVSITPCAAAGDGKSNARVVRFGDASQPASAASRSVHA
ncbi:MAG: carbon storage regulator [Pirellulaceae bacterium]